MSQLSQKPKSNKVKANSTLLGHSELIRKVQSLMDKELPQNQMRFSEKLTQNMDFNGSLKLSELNGQLRILEKRSVGQKDISHKNFEKGAPGELKAASLSAAFNRVQQSLLLNIQQSFDASVEQPRFPLPSVKRNGKEIELSGYQSFYLAQQSEMSAKIQGLRTYSRETLNAISPNMAKLALIDKTLEETIGLPLRSGFLAVSSVLKKHTLKLENKWLESDESTSDHNNFLHGLHSDLQQLLLAELELRLQPVQGLLDALNHEVKEVDE